MLHEFQQKPGLGYLKMEALTNDGFFRPLKELDSPWFRKKPKEWAK